MSKDLTCGICFDSTSAPHDSPPCRHTFCTECWGAYIHTSIQGGPGCLALRCPEPSCGAAVSPEMIKRLASDEDYNKYRRYIFSSYVEGNPKAKWCPSPGCDCAVEFYAVGTKNYDVLCRCWYGFCWNCTEEAHRPVDCETVAKWMAKFNTESHNMKWILAFTKPCPKCKKPIEKNQGCNHMTCRSPCGYQFCWTCLGDWNAHSYSSYKCNSYKTDENTTDREKAKRYLVRYMHYFERWANNRSSEEKALADLHKMENENIEKLSISQDLTVTHLRFVTDAWVQILACRRILKWSYALGFFLPEQELTKKQFFEYLQGEAELGLEKLHKCAEKDLQVYIDASGRLEDFIDFRTRLTGLTAVTRNYFENLVKALENNLCEVDSKKKSNNTKRDYDQIGNNLELEYQAAAWYEDKDKW